jgi:ABC-type nitrate/sulfonate/bicarbonate transport system permease component
MSIDLVPPRGAISTAPEMAADVASRGATELQVERQRARSSPSAWGRIWRTWRPSILGLASVALLVLIWQLATMFHLVNTLFLSPPLAVAQAMVDLVTSGDLMFNLGVSGEEFVIGLGISIVLGAVLGILAGWYLPSEEFMRPIVIGLNSMPHVAIVPVLILLFGIGLTPKVVIVVLSCAVTILLNTAAGVMNVDTHLMRMSRSFGSKDWQAIKTIVLPSIVPFFMTGVRISVGRALTAVVVSEFFASKAGVGNVMISAANSFNMPRMYAMLLFITALGVVLTQGATMIEQRMQRWRG